MNIDFAGQAGIVTGAGRGMGRAFALDLARRGARLILNGRPREEGGACEIEDVAAEIGRAGGQVHIVYASVDGRYGADRVADAALERFGSIDFLINNAGILRNGPFEALSPTDFEEVLKVHLAGSFFLGQRAFVAMKEKEYGRIVNVSSTTALVEVSGLANYAAAKGGVLGLTRAMAIEGGSHGIKVNALVPSAIGQMQAASPIPGFAERFGNLRERLWPRMAPNTVTPLAVYLASLPCERNGEIWTACAGRFARVAVCFASGWVASDPDSVAAEDIAENIGLIASLDGGFEPRELDDIYRDIIERLPRS